MSKTLQKYFIAIVPEGEIQENATAVKLQLKEKFNLKYALKSPAHVTLKMPFLWNEAKENLLISRLEAFFLDQSPFGLTFKGIGKFGKRVIYIKVKDQPELVKLQSNLTMMCKTDLKLKVELSDFAYHPHMTLAFKDIKKPLFLDYFDFLKSKGFSGAMEVGQAVLLKKEDRQWVAYKTFRLPWADIE